MGKSKYKPNGVDKHERAGFEKNADTGYWVSSYLLDLIFRYENKELAAQMKKWEAAGELSTGK